MSSNSTNKQLPRHDPRLVNSSIEQAKQFYEHDHKLNTSDRRALSNYFWQKMIISPLVGLPVSFAFVMAPNILKKRGILFNPKKKHRFLQVILGFMGLGMGERFGGSIATSIHVSMLAENDAAKNAYEMLSQYPSQLGSRYYSMTALTPALALKDPRTTDWNANPLFPLCLVMSQDIIVKLRQAEQNRHKDYRARQETLKQNQIAQRSQKSDSEQPYNSTGSSWDSVIQRADKGNQNINVETGKYQESNKQGYQEVDNNETSQVGGGNESQGKGSRWDYSSPSDTPFQTSFSVSTQSEFDKLIELDRELAQDDQFKDDFAESEKKW